MHVVNSQSEVSEGSEEEEEDEEEEEEEESEGEGGREETDAPHFTPFPNRINITSELCAQWLSKHSECFGVTAAWSPLMYMPSVLTAFPVYIKLFHIAVLYVVPYCTGSTIL